jgi:branched-chain amino acid transport system substrate-binding protein
VGPGQEGWQAAVETIAAGEDINYEGAAGSVDLDENGDVSKGAILIWQIQGEAIEDTDERGVDLTAQEAAATPVS